MLLDSHQSIQRNMAVNPSFSPNDGFLSLVSMHHPLAADALIHFFLFLISLPYLLRSKEKTVAHNQTNFTSFHAKEILPLYRTILYKIQWLQTLDYHKLILFNNFTNVDVLLDIYENICLLLI